MHFILNYKARPQFQLISNLLIFSEFQLIGERKTFFYL